MSETLRILLVEDNPGDADLITELLSQDDRVAFELDHAERLTKALSTLEQERIDIILLDLGLPDSAGLDTLHVMRQKTPNLPIVVLTGNSDESTALAAIQEGAQDYLVKGQVTGALLSTVLLYARERSQSALRLQESEEQLHQSQKMEALGQLAGGIAHDFNNLLTAIIGYSDVMLSDPEFADSPWSSDLTQIRVAADRASALTRQILAFSRYQTLRPRVVSLNDVLAGMEPLLRRTLGESIELEIHRQSDLGHSEIDVHQFEQVLMNLAINARDAMPSGGRLTIETLDVDLDEEYCRIHSEVDAGHHVMLAVSDTGVGMNETTRRRAFEPFFTTKDLGEGTGLGLATVHGIVKQSHGHIGLCSELGIGTSFKIYLPRVNAPKSEQGEPTTTAATPSPRGDGPILLVEDEVPLRDLVARVLGGLGYNVLSAGTASHALEVLEGAGGKIDLLLTDLVLPGGLQGKNLALDLVASMPGLPVIYMSGYTREPPVLSGRPQEVVDFLEKPFTPSALAGAVRAVLDKARAPS